MAVSPSVDVTVIGSSSTWAGDVEATAPTKTSSKGAEGVTGGNSAWLTAGIIVADVVGAGILGMPSAIANFGWVLGSVLLVVMLAANVHISILLWRVRMQSAACSNAMTMTDLAAGAFSAAPAWQRQVVVVLTAASQVSFLFGLMGVYLLSAGKGLGLVLYMQEVCLPWWTLIGAAILLPFAATARNMGSWSSLVWVNIVTLTGTVLIPLGYYTFVGVDAIRPESSEVLPIANLSYAGVLRGLSTFTFGMTSQFMLTEIIGEMRDPAEFPKAYACISAPFQLTAFLVAALGGYFFIGDKVSGMLNENLPFGIALQLAAACLIIHMLISYLIKGVVFCKYLQSKLDGEYARSDDKRCRSWASWVFFVILILVAAWVVANLVPFFSAAVDLLGSSLTPLSCWILPIVFYARWWYDAGENRPRVSYAEWALLAAELSFAVLLLVLGTASSVQTIVSEWHTYGMPFACNCEGIWNTCECSASHVGMDLICNATGAL